ncbi:Uncharacterized conserved protein [Nocardioides exalbidus]|uniref:Uncharacterized conserved protein n=1 Tax=Nocardioides exalbidus TaxID=402596 RepID=A0A1H4YZ98_9ACTN|nr:YciI family protein [Nocardioides exalbidus]SED22360.1 Uncharacterized conserved protein [Nocardioides exalbidus]
MPRYLLLIHGDEKQWSTTTDADRAVKDAAHRDFAAAVGARLVLGHELHPASAARTVRRGDDGAPAATDGPFAETRESVGGLYVIEADSMDEVVALAATLHEVTESHSGVEVREVLG